MREYRLQKKRIYTNDPILAEKQRKSKAKQMRKYRLKKWIKKYIYEIIYLTAESSCSPKKELEYKERVQ